MALGTIAKPVINQHPNGIVTYTPEELSEIIEYEKIVQFRDSVVAGTHPRVKIPAQLEKSLILPDSSQTIHPKAQARTSTQSELVNVKFSSNDESSVKNTSPDIQRLSVSHLATSKKPDIQPVLLEKSDDLIKAEIQLQRQRLERALTEQVEHQRFAAKTLLQTSESLPNFDIAEVLSKALAIVPSIPISKNEPTNTCQSTGSNSFDDNTFYSSQNETPSPINSIKGLKSSTTKPVVPETFNGQTFSQIAKELKEVDSKSFSSLRRNDKSTEQNNVLNFSSQNNIEIREKDVELNNFGPSISVEESIREVEKPVILRPTSAEAGNSTFRNERASYANTLACTTQPYQKNYGQVFASESVVIEAPSNDLPFIAPQPSRVSPLPVASDSMILGSIPSDRQPAQIIALRNLHALSSADSSPRVRSKERRREKKKRRAKDISTPNSPYVKVEPKSPSSHIPPTRPQKRYRGPFDSGLNHGRSHPNLDMLPQERTKDPSRWRHQSFERAIPYDPREYDPSFQKLEGDDVSQRISSAHLVRRPQSPQSPPHITPYHTNRMRSRAASTVVGGTYPENREYAGESLTRVSVRPNMHREGSRSPLHQNIPFGSLRQIIVDENGRQYYSSTSTPFVGQSGPHAIRYHDEEPIYERLPMRTVSSRMPIDVYENNGYLMHRRSPVYTASRRVVTQPENLVASSSGYRPLRQREYSVYPPTVSPHGEEHDMYRATQEHRQMSHFDEPPREYLRATTARPESTRYGAPIEYLGRTQYMRPEPPPRVQDLRRDMITQVPPDYSARPIDTSQRDTFPVERYFDAQPKIVSHSEHIVNHEGGGYYNESSTRRPSDDLDHMRVNESSRYEEKYRRKQSNNLLIDPARARESPIIVYADELRRDTYR